MNKITLAGVIDSEIAILKKSKRNVVEFYLSSKRISGAEDTIRIIAKEELLNECGRGDKVIVIGSVRTKNKDGHLLIYVHADDIFYYLEEDMDIVEANGFICSKKELRKTPLSDQTILEMTVAVNNDFGTSYIPCILWNGLAKRFENVEIGTEVNIKGRLQSREYAKVLNETQFEIRTAYELSAFYVEKVEDK
jgi:single-stranded DNA-binding protein